MYRLRQNEVDLTLRIIEQLNCSAGADNLRQAIAEDVLRLLDADYLASYAWNDARGRFEDAASLNMSPDNLARYEAYYQFHDPITPLLQRHRSATLVDQVMPYAVLRRTEFYNDFLRRDGLYTGVNLYAYDRDRNIGDLRVWRSSRRREMGSREVRLLDVLRPHFVNALRNVRSLDLGGAEHGWRELWESHPNPCFVFDQDGRQLHRNRAACELVDGLAPPVRADLMAFVAHALHGCANDTTWRSFQPTVVHGDRCDTPLVLVQLVPMQRIDVDRTWLQQAYGLTPRESAVCLLVAKGLPDKAIATALGISFWTVRTHLDHAYRKCNAAGRTELMRALLGGAVRFDS